MSEKSSLIKKIMAIPLLVAIICLPIFISDFIKVSPGDPNYGAANFAFDDFVLSTHKSKDGSAVDIKDVLRRILPPGSDKAYVDDVLIQQARCGKPFSHSPGQFSYKKNAGLTNLAGWVVSIQFDENMKTKSIDLAGAVVY